MMPEITSSLTFVAYRSAVWIAFCCVGKKIARPTGTTSLKALPAMPRRRRGSTSPPLVGVEPNPGPQHVKARRWIAKAPHQLRGHRLSDQQRGEIKELISLGLSVPEISKRLGVKEETIRGWKRRLEATGSMKPRAPPGRRPKRSFEGETQTSEEKRPRKRWKAMQERQLGKVEGLLEVGLPERTVATLAQRSPSTVHRCKEILKAGQPLERKKKPGSGRPRKTTDRDDRHFYLAVVRDKDVFAPQAALEVKSSAGQPVLDSRNVQRRLHEHGLITKKKRKKPYMTKAHKKARLAWAKKHQHWTVERWRHVLWSDESPFTVWPAPRCGRVWVHKGKTGIDERQIEPTKKHGGGHLNVWGCFSASGVGSLKWVTGSMKATNYHGILTRRVLPVLRSRSVQEPELVWLFQHDNASVHTASECTKYLKKRETEEGFKVLDWPSQSPDLNPIENLWSILKASMKKRLGPPKNKEELWAQLLVEWTHLKDDLLARLVDSMPQRCQDVIAARGGPTRH
jgi:transposase